MEDVKNPLSENLVVCDHCLMAIESREGDQVTKRHYIDIEYDENGDFVEVPESYCDWCEEYGFDVLFEIV